jgi:hypothetical protein
MTKSSLVSRFTRKRGWLDMVLPLNGVRQLLERPVLADRAPDVHGAAIDVDPAGVDVALGVARHVAAVVEVAGRARLGGLHALVERERLAAVGRSRNAGAADVVVDRPADLAAGSAVELGFGMARLTM